MKNQTGIIILDGPDACGKTTLQTQFVTECNAIPIHLTYPAQDGLNMFEYQTREMMKAIKLAETNLVVVDRHWISERIYAKVFRNGSPWPMMGQMMHYSWIKHAALYILCLPHTIPLTLKRHHENIDSKHPYPDDKFTELLSEYLGFWEEHSSSPFFMRYRIEFEGTNFSYFLHAALERLRLLIKSQYRPALNVYENNISGHILPARVLLVGMQLNPKEFHNKYGIYHPFYEYGNSSLFLHLTISLLNVKPEYLMLTNSYYSELRHLTSPHISELHHKGIKLVALGKEAETVIKDMGYPFIGIPHPQYAKRFAIKDYPQMLQEAITNVCIK